MNLSKSNTSAIFRTKNLCIWIRSLVEKLNKETVYTVTTLSYVLWHTGKALHYIFFNCGLQIIMTTVIFWTYCSGSFITKPKKKNAFINWKWRKPYHYSVIELILSFMGNVHKNKYYCELILPDDTLLYKLKKRIWNLFADNTK